MVYEGERDRDREREREMWGIYPTTVNKIFPAE